MKVLYLVAAGLQVLAACMSLPSNAGIAVMSLVAAAASTALWVMARKKEPAAGKTSLDSKG